MSGPNNAGRRFSGADLGLTLEGARYEPPDPISAPPESVQSALAERAICGAVIQQIDSQLAVAKDRTRMEYGEWSLWRSRAVSHRTWVGNRNRFLKAWINDNRVNQPVRAVSVDDRSVGAVGDRPTAVGALERMALDVERARRAAWSTTAIATEAIRFVSALKGGDPAKTRRMADELIGTVVHHAGRMGLDDEALGVLGVDALDGEGNAVWLADLPVEASS